MQRELRLNIRPARVHVLTLPLANRSCCLPELSLPICKMEVGRLIHLGAVRTYPVACLHAVLGTSPCVSVARYGWSCLRSGAPVFLLVHPTEPGPGLLAAEPLISKIGVASAVAELSSIQPHGEAEGTLVSTPVPWLRGTASPPRPAGAWSLGQGGGRTPTPIGGPHPCRYGTPHGLGTWVLTEAFSYQSDSCRGLVLVPFRHTLPAAPRVPLKHPEPKDRLPSKPARKLRHPPARPPWPRPRGSRGGGEAASVCHGLCRPLGGTIKQGLQAGVLPQPSHLTFLLVPTCPAPGPQPCRLKEPESLSRGGQTDRAPPPAPSSPSPPREAGPLPSLGGAAGGAPGRRADSF